MVLVGEGCIVESVVLMILVGEACIRNGGGQHLRGNRFRRGQARLACPPSHKVRARLSIKGDNDRAVTFGDSPYYGTHDPARSRVSSRKASHCHACHTASIVQSRALLGQHEGGRHAHVRAMLSHRLRAEGPVAASQVGHFLHCSTTAGRQPLQTRAWPHAKRTSRGASSQIMHSRASSATAAVATSAAAAASDDQTAVAEAAPTIASSRASTSGSGIRSSAQRSSRP
eukprot:scaffold8418_cov65-Phaeocystis_antarctica.AAC.2